MWASGVLFAALMLQQMERPPAPSPAPPVQSQVSGLDPDDLPVSIERIQRALAQPPAIRLDGDKTVFRVQVLGRKPTIEDILGPEFWKGPVQSGGGMSHSEFLNMVTPEQFRGMSAFTNGEAATIAATSFALQWALLKAIDTFKAAKSNREKEAARKEVEAALADLEKARRKAGLPPR